MSITHAQHDGASTTSATFDDIYRTHYLRCQRVAYRVTRDHHLAEDAAQDALFDYARRPHHFDSDRGTMSKWLTILTHRRAVDLVRREQSQTRRGDQAAAHLLTQPDPTPDPEGFAIRRAEHVELRKAVLRLPPRQQQVLLLLFAGDHTELATAQALSVPLGTVKSRKRAAVRALRTSLGHLVTD